MSSATATTSAYLRGRITGALGGRAAEELVYGDITTGAESDLEQVTRIARQMVGRWGMSEAIGPVSILPAPGQEQVVLPGQCGCAVGGDSESRRVGDPADHRRVLRPRAREAAREPRAAGSRWPPRCSSTRRSTSSTPTAWPGWNACRTARRASCRRAGTVARSSPIKRQRRGRRRPSRPSPRTAVMTRPRQRVASPLALRRGLAAERS